MQEELNFASACAEISRIGEANKEAEKRKKAQDLEDCAPATARKLNKDEASVGKLTTVRSNIICNQFFTQFQKLKLAGAISIAKSKYINT